MEVWGKVSFNCVQPTSLETLDPQHAKFYSTAETTLCPVPRHPRTSRGCPSPWRTPGHKPCPMRSFCSSAGRKTARFLQTHTSLVLCRHAFVQLKHSTVSSRPSSCAEAACRHLIAEFVLFGSASSLLIQNVGHSGPCSVVFFVLFSVQLMDPLLLLRPEPRHWGAGRGERTPKVTSLAFEQCRLKLIQEEL